MSPCFWYISIELVSCHKFTIFFSDQFWFNSIIFHSIFILVQKPINNYWWAFIYIKIKRNKWNYIALKYFFPISTLLFFAQAVRHLKIFKYLYYYYFTVINIHSSVVNYCTRVRSCVQDLLHTCAQLCAGFNGEKINILFLLSKV